MSATAAKLIVIALCAGLAACSTTDQGKGISVFISPPAGQASVRAASPINKVRPCNPAHPCVIEVKVRADASGPTTLVVADKDLFLNVKSNQNPEIIWRLVVENSSYQNDFAFDLSDGINFGQSVSKCDTKTAKEFKCRVNPPNSDMTAYKYTVHVVVTGGSNHNNPPALDPWVIAD